MQGYSVRLGRKCLTQIVHISTLKITMTETRDQFYTIEELAEILKIKKVTLYRMARAGKIPAVKIGKVWRVSSKFLDDLMSGKGVE